MGWSQGKSCKDHRDQRCVHFHDILREYMVVVKGIYFAECAARKAAFTDRASIASIWLFSSKGRGTDVNFSVPYDWLSRERPDPDRFHLWRLVLITDELKAYYGMEEVGVITDCSSLWQSQGPHGTRSEAQLGQSDGGLRCINTSYDHREVTVIKLIATPENQTRKYDDRRRALFESITTNGKSASVRPFSNITGRLNALNFCGDFDPSDQRAHGRRFVHLFQKEKNCSHP